MLIDEERDKVSICFAEVKRDFVAMKCCVLCELCLISGQCRDEARLVLVNIV